MSLSPLASLALIALPLAGCTTVTPSTERIADEPAPVYDDDDDDVPAPDPELDCDDGLDEDEDGLIDCADDDCSDVFHCTWPDEIELHTMVEFFGNEIAQAFGVDDCLLEFEGVLTDESSRLGFDDGDLVFEGPVEYLPGDCPEDYVSRPATVAFAFGFLDENTREAWSRDSDTGEWQALGEVTAANGEFRIETLEPVMYDVPLFGDTEVGTFRLTRTFRDR
jgi:hypothetical protein